MIKNMQIQRYQIEDAINNLDQKITDYLVKISSQSFIDTGFN